MNHNIYNRGSNGAWLPVNLYVSALTDLSGPFTLGVWVLAQNGAMFTLLVADMELCTVLTCTHFRHRNTRHFRPVRRHFEI